MTVQQILVICALAAWPRPGSLAPNFWSEPVQSIATLAAAPKRTSSGPEANTYEVAAQALCRTFIGEYVSHDHAIRIQNDIRSRGFQAWIEPRGCLTCSQNTRTYAVFAVLPCR